MRIGGITLATLVAALSACGAQDNSAQAAATAEDDAVEPAQQVATLPTDLRGPDLQGFLDAKESHPYRPLTMEARLALFNRSYSVERPTGKVTLERTVDITGTGVTSTPRIGTSAKGDELTRLRLDFAGSWQGLQVTGIGYDFDRQYELGQREEPLAKRLLVFFEGPAELVAAKLAEIGLRVRPDGSPLAATSDKATWNDEFEWHGFISWVDEREGRTALVYREGLFNAEDFGLSDADMAKANDY